MYLGIAECFPLRKFWKMASKPGKDEPIAVVKTPADLQRLRLEKLMKNPEKPVVLPEKSKAAKMKEPPEFIRNVWGSSAGAGSGDFHVYRGVRRREYARQKFSAEQNAKMGADEEYHKKVEENKKAAEERTAKKRAKRLKKKQKMKNKKPRRQQNQTGEQESDSSESEEEEETNSKNSNSQDKNGSHDAEDVKSASVDESSNDVDNKDNEMRGGYRVRAENDSSDSGKEDSCDGES